MLYLNCERWLNCFQQQSLNLSKNVRSFDSAFLMIKGLLLKAINASLKLKDCRLHTYKEKSKNQRLQGFSTVFTLIHTLAFFVVYQHVVPQLPGQQCKGCNTKSAPTPQCCPPHFPPGCQPIKCQDGAFFIIGFLFHDDLCPQEKRKLFPLWELYYPRV